MKSEPTIIINGQRLTDAQAMSVRVAVVNFLMDLKSDGLGEDEHGRTMTHLYQKRLGEVQEIMFERS